MSQDNPTQGQVPYSKFPILNNLFPNKEGASRFSNILNYTPEQIQALVKVVMELNPTPDLIKKRIQETLDFATEIEGNPIYNPDETTMTIVVKLQTEIERFNKSLVGLPVSDKKPYEMEVLKIINMLKSSMNSNFGKGAYLGEEEYVIAIEILETLIQKPETPTSNEITVDNLIKASIIPDSIYACANTIGANPTYNRTLTKNPITDRPQIISALLYGDRGYVHSSIMDLEAHFNPNMIGNYLDNDLRRTNPQGQLTQHTDTFRDLAKNKSYVETTKLNDGTSLVKVTCNRGAIVKGRTDTDTRDAVISIEFRCKDAKIDPIAVEVTKILIKGNDDPEKVTSFTLAKLKLIFELKSTKPN